MLQDIATGLVIRFNTSHVATNIVAAAYVAPVQNI